MNKSMFYILAAALIILSNTVLCQDEILYGSNNGKYISVFSTKIYYEEYGQGTPLLLFHGNFSSMALYSKVIPELSKHFRVIAVDLPGFGRSYHADTISHQLFSDYMSEMIDVMRLDSVYVMGCSMGAGVALILAHDRPDKVKRIISDAGVVHADGATLRTLELFYSKRIGNRSKSWIESYNNSNPQPELLERLIKYDLAMIEELPLLTDSELNNIEPRTLILMGDGDGMIRLEHGLELYRAINNSELCIVPGAGHCVCNTRPNIMNTIIINFLMKE
jgi:pimeloyl-ACP methyl ester carboxylesterase